MLVGCRTCKTTHGFEGSALDLDGSRLVSAVECCGKAMAVAVRCDGPCGSTVMTPTGCGVDLTTWPPRHVCRECRKADA